jgi:hypothetical protein
LDSSQRSPASEAGTLGLAELHPVDDDRWIIHTLSPLPLLPAQRTLRRVRGLDIDLQNARGRVMAKRTTHRSSKGTKLYAVRDKKGKFKDIQSYKRAHGADIKRKSKKET